MMLSRRIEAIVLLIVFSTALHGCVSVPVARPSATERAYVTPTPASDLVHPDGQRLLELTPEMREFARRYVPPPGSSPRARLTELLRALTNVRDIDYETAANLTAQQAFEQRRANCLAFSSLVVAMASEVGIKARFQEVDLPPSWEGRNADLLLRLRHVNVVTDVRAAHGFTMVDFRSDRYDESFPHHSLTNNQAIARFYNNIGVEAMLQGDLDTALANVLAAIEIEPKLSFGWVNLGLVYRRRGDNERAEIAYREALNLAPSDPSALTNLARLYEQTGRTELSAELAYRANKQRTRDPYFNFAMAQRAYAKDQLDEAKNWLDRAIGRRAREHRFHHLMGIVQWALGDHQQARRSMEVAVKHAKDAKVVRQYKQQLAEWDSAVSQS